MSTGSWQKNSWGILKKPTTKYSLVFFLSVGFIAGVFFWDRPNTAIEETKRLEPCISCQEMRDNVSHEYQQAIHYANRTGVRATVFSQTLVDAELRRLQEREQATRKAQEQNPDVRLPRTKTTDSTRIPQDESPCFVIKQISLVGDAQQKFTWLLKTLSGESNDDTPSNRCLGALGVGVVIKRAQDALVQEGYVTSRVLAEPQDLSSGQLILTVIPGRLRKIRIAEPNDGRGTVWNALPLASGDILNLRAIEQALENFKRSPTSEADIKIEPVENAPAMSDLVVSYKQPMPLRLSASVDDSGTKNSGKYQGSLTFSFDNMLKLNDLFYWTSNKDLGGGNPGSRGTKGHTVYYSIPFGYWLASITSNQSNYFQEVAGSSQTYLYSGTSELNEVKLSRIVYRDALSKANTFLKTFQRKSNNYVDDTEVEVQRRVVGGWEAGFDYTRYIANATAQSSLTYKRGTGAFGSLPSPEEIYGEGTSRFALVYANATLNLPFPLGGQQLRYNGEWRRQWARTSLTPQDRFAVGGRYTVRGFDGELLLSAENGWLIRNDIGLMLGDSGQELYLGVDYGQVSGPSLVNLVGDHLTGGVFGLRGHVRKLQYDFFIGAPIKKPNGFITSSKTAGFMIGLSI